ncbi:MULTISPECIES: acylphosphatase [Shewanella]|uniref:Acylphosphatase n=2 Tax=Shewanella TaxID=22 RepID=ACYP_SHEAM|nr:MULTISPECIES: acylphosphatase [Shewanella]A1S579.1 RecName: Full=Acylphosphatase; AltName: Full=Acylphosphate phosphohydrolase [Shewanella amazonensis SB2B]ABL99535.1 acylphosphatase [Shewanella amazonensis SB2B]MCL2916771.1 acylphosphatase [Shewanella litorisediminis]QRH03061.1 acylphosphatase [Shewanella litorisediminis]QYJ76670.1 acylphosphatase [Shewanella sp. FJAT-52076]QYK06589.1 acylphosphatase [Shewanella zhangzhouensis]
MRRVLIRVKGKVQGVCFRRFALERARELGVTGYVTNMDDGSVQILAQGSAPLVEKLIDWCWEGSPAASVNAVEVNEDEADEIYLDFSITQS